MPHGLLNISYLVDPLVRGPGSGHLNPKKYFHKRNKNLAVSKFADKFSNLSRRLRLLKHKFGQ